jgi:hypothetical protein
MLTAAAARWDDLRLDDFDGVASRRELGAVGIGADHIASQLHSRRWQRCGKAIVLHNGPLTAAQHRRAALIDSGPRAVLTSFTAAEVWGLRGWERREVHVLVPNGARRPTLTGVVVHQTSAWSATDIAAARRLHRLAPSLVLGASSFPTARPGCGLLAAAVQQRLLGADQLRAALRAAPRARHRTALVSAVDDIAQGAQALSEIDFVRLCRRHGLPTPARQAVRVGPGGRRRYLDAEWLLPDGRRVAVEVDGALHLSARQWQADQLRQNEIVLDGTLVLRFPSVVVRADPELVSAQLRRVLAPLLRRR